jgi:hypothetical protein
LWAPPRRRSRWWSWRALFGPGRATAARGDVHAARQLLDGGGEAATPEIPAYEGDTLFVTNGSLPEMLDPPTIPGTDIRYADPEGERRHVAI